MKTPLFIVLGIALLWACGSPSDLAQKKTRLDEVRAQMAALQKEAQSLEAEIAKLDTSASKSLRTRAVEVATPTLGTFRRFVEVQGNVEADNNILASPEMPGVVRRILVKEGDRVKKGQLLAELENTAMVQGLEEAKTGLRLAEETYRRTQRLWEQNIGSEIQYLQSKTNYEAMALRVKGLEAQVAMSQIKSPIDGEVDDVALKLGEMASPGMTGVRVVNLNHIKLTAPLADALAANISVGTPVSVFLSDLGIHLDRKVTFISKVVNPGNRSVIVEVDLTGAHPNLRPNMTGGLKINDLSVDSALMVPTNLIQSLPEGNFIMLAQGKKALRQAIETGPSYNGVTVITKGLQPNSVLITAGNSEVVDGQPIDFKP
jgi:RND family efflux transporter MFP subunit